MVIAIIGFVCAVASAPERTPIRTPIPTSEPRCEDFKACVGGRTDDFEAIGKCCYEFSDDDDMVEKQYCTSYPWGYGVGGNWRYASYCGLLRLADSDEQYSVPTDSRYGDPTPYFNKTRLIAFCNGYCEKEISENRQSYLAARCMSRDVKACLTKGDSLAECWGRFGYAITSLRNSGDLSYSGTDFNYGTRCLTANPTNRLDCQAFCENFDAANATGEYQYGIHCVQATELRNCLEAGDQGTCCAKYPDLVTSFPQCDNLTGWGDCSPSFSGTIAGRCVNYCNNLPHWSIVEPPEFCRRVDFEKCRVAGTDPTTCCAKWPARPTSTPVAGLPLTEEYCGIPVLNDAVPPVRFPVPIQTLCRELLYDDIVRCDLGISRAELEGKCNQWCNALPPYLWDNYYWCDSANRAPELYEECRFGTPTPTPPTPAKPGYDPTYRAWSSRVRNLGGGSASEQDAHAICCGKSGYPGYCRWEVAICEALYSSTYEGMEDKFEDSLDDLTDEYAALEEERLQQAHRLCRLVCDNFEDPPDWCDEVPGLALSVAAIAAIVVGVIAFLLLVALIIVLVLCICRKGGSASEPKA